MNSIFKMLLDTANDVAYAVTKVNIGQVINAAVNGLAVFAFRDSSGNATMPQLNDEGALPVVFDAGTLVTIPAVKKTKAEMETTGQGNRELLGSVSVLPNRKYTCPAMKVSATRLTLFELVLINDLGGTNAETLIDFATLEAGQTNFSDENKDTFTVGADPAEIRLYATHIDSKASDTYGKASVNLVAAN